MWSKLPLYSGWIIAIVDNATQNPVTTVMNKTHLIIFCFVNWNNKKRNGNWNEKIQLKL